jgi:hypothetical protein
MLHIIRVNKRENARRAPEEQQKKIAKENTIDPSSCEPRLELSVNRLSKVLSN